MLRSAFAALVLLAAGCSATGSLRDTDGLLTTVGIVEYGEPEGDEFRFNLAQIEQQFVVAPTMVPDMDALYDALESSGETGRSIRVTFDVASGSFEPGSTLPSYTVRQVEYDGRPIAGMKGSRQVVTQSPPAETALARAVAFHGAGQSDRALPILDRALEGGSLRPELLALALNTRGNLLFDTAWDSSDEPTEAVDRQLIRALDDFRRWTGMEPDSFDARSAMGLTLRDLGAYEEAIAVFQEQLSRWPDRELRLVTRIGATYRVMGDYERALGVLDDLVDREGPQVGMMFHYHRGWTLNMLGRYEEAIAEFAEGLTTQPDYNGVFMRRACSYARLGRLEEALADRRRATDLKAGYPTSDHSTKANLHDRDWERSVVASLEAGIASGSREPNSAPCEGYWTYGEKKRDRSRLLPVSNGGDSPAINAI